MRKRSYAVRMAEMPARARGTRYLAWSTDGRLAFEIYDLTKPPDLGVCKVVTSACRTFPIASHQPEKAGPPGRYGVSNVHFLEGGGIRLELKTEAGSEEIVVPEA